MPNHAFEVSQALPEERGKCWLKKVADKKPPMAIGRCDSAIGE